MAPKTPAGPATGAAALEGLAEAAAALVDEPEPVEPAGALVDEPEPDDPELLVEEAPAADEPAEDAPVSPGLHSALVGRTAPVPLQMLLAKEMTAA